MIQNIKSILKHSSVYGIGNAAQKAIGLITLPLYSMKLASVAEFGIFGIIDITINILVIVFTFGQANSILMFNNSAEYKHKRKQAFFTIVTSVVFINILLLTALYFSQNYIFKSLFIPVKYSIYFKLGLMVVLVRVLTTVLMAKLRADERSVFFTIVTLIKISAVLLLIIYFVGFAGYGIKGILYAYILSELLILAVLIPSTLKEMNFNFDNQIFKEAVVFGLPLIFSAIGIMLLNLSDRYIIQYLKDSTNVGLYDFGYRIAGALNMFLIMPFNTALLPSAYKVYGQPNDKRYYSKLLTYMTFVGVWAGLALSLFAEEIVKLLALKSGYYPAYAVVPLIVFAYVFSGMRNITSLGMMLTKKTGYIGLLTLFFAVFNIVLNFILIPRYGIMAAAFTTLLSFVLFYLSAQIISNKFYPIPFENGKIVKVLTSGVVLYFAAQLAKEFSFVFYFIARLAAVLVFPFVLLYTGFYEKIELETLNKIKGKLGSPKAILKELNSFFFNSGNEQ